MAQTKMATETEVEGETTVSVPPEMEAQMTEEKHVSELPSDEKQTAPPTPEEGKTEETKVESEGGESTMSERGQRRVGNLVGKLKEETQRAKKAEEDASALRSLLEKMRSPDQSTQDFGNQAGFGNPPWEQPNVNIPEPGTEITPDQYKRDVIGAADALTDAKLRSFQNNLARYDLLKEDSSYVREKYSVLRPGSEDYSKEKETTVAKLYDKASKSDPTLRLKDFVDSIMSFHQAGQLSGQQKVTKKFLEQESNSAIPPSATVNKKSGTLDLEALSTEEKEAWLKENGLWDAA